MAGARSDRNRFLDGHCLDRCQKWGAAIAVLAEVRRVRAEARAPFQRQIDTLTIGQLEILGFERWLRADWVQRCEFTNETSAPPVADLLFAAA